MRIRNSLQTKFYLAYSLIFISIMLMVSIPMYVYLKNNVEKNTINRIDDAFSNAKARLDEQMSQFDVMSRLLYFQTNVSWKPAVGYIEELSRSDDSYESYQLRNVLNNFITMLTVVYPDAYSVRLFGMNGQLISNQPLDGNVLKPLDNYDRLQPILQSKGEAFLEYAAKDPWMPSDSTPVFIFSRLLLPLETRAGMFEMQVRAEDLISLDDFEQVKGADLTLFNNDQPIYSTLQGPELDESKIFSIYDQMKMNFSVANGSSSGNSIVGKNYVFYQTIDKTGISAILTVPMRTIYEPLNLFRNITLSLMVVLISFSVAVFYVLTRILTKPLRSLKNSIDQIDLDDKQLDMDNKYRMDEIHLINRAFRNMNQRLQNSLEETVRFRTLQLQANFNLLQAQINPHFLFNMLGFIQSSAENRDFAQVQALSRNLLGFFRYSVSSEAQVITLDQEVDFTNRYLELMKFRFMHRLSYRIDIDPMLSHLVFPKMILQPLVENCIRHGMQDRTEAMEIVVNVYVDRESWVIQILDNGSGFSKEGLSAVVDKVEGALHRLYAESELERLSLGGMGIASTISRLKIMFKEQFSYAIGNRVAEGGVEIRLRGPMVRHSSDIHDEGDEQNAFDAG